MAQRLVMVPMPIVMIKEEEVSDSEEVHCRLCHKAFASTLALENHARMDHIEAYENGDPTVWTKSQDDPVIKSKSVYGKKLQKYQSHIQKQETMEPVDSSSNNVSYIIIKSQDDRPRKVKREKETKDVAAKRQKASEPITGPFECVEASAAAADGVCRRLFLSCCEYSRHAREEHARRRRSPRCQVCERPLPTGTGDPDKPYACESCGESYATPDELQDHTTMYHVKLKPYECGICHKRFTQQGGVMQHMRMHTGDRPFACKFCEKAFTQRSGLDQHLRTHTKQKPYSCVVCSKAFTQSVHLKQHMRTHTNVTPFQCGICDKRFKQSSHLNYHLKNHNPSNMTTDQRRTYTVLREPAPSEVEGNEVEIESQVEMTEEMELELAEQSLIEEDTYIIGGTYGE